MSTVQSATDVTVDVENVGGIEDATVSFTPGVTVLTGRNATNRTSLLTSVMAALGSDDVAMKSDADRGTVTLTMGEKSYTRTFERDGERVASDGDPYLDDPEVADLFAFLLESNEARRAVRRGDDLRELIMRPVDTDGIHEEIDRLEAEKRRLDDRIAELSDLETRLRELEAERDRLEADVEAAETTLSARREELAQLDATPDESREQREQLEARLSELEETRTDLERTRTQLETERASLQSLREERSELADEQASLPEDPAERLAEIEGELTSLREHKRSLESTITQLGQIVQFNESVVDGERESVLDALGADESDGDVTDKLLEAEETVICWTCGTGVEESAIKDTLATLRSLRQEKVGERRELSDRIDSFQADKRDLESVRAERERIDERLAEVDDEIERREDNVEHLRDAAEQLETRVAALEEAVTDVDEPAYGDVLEAHRAVNEAEFELSSLEDDLAETEAEIERVEDRLDERADLEDRREDLDAQLTSQRTRIERLEADVVETFNDHMAEVLALLDYENIARVWIERRERETREGRRSVTERIFDLHVVRGGETAAYEDTVETLSESEREVAGLVFALAGYLVHDLHETVPFMLLDSLEAIDAARIADLVDYFGEHVPYLVVALLEEDAAAVDASHERIEMG